MARDTKERILKSAETLFSQRQFDDVSIAEICRVANVSNGAYYRYFPNKEELLITLVDDFLNLFREALDEIKGETVADRLLSFIDIVLKTGKERKSKVTIYREGQYRFYGYEDKLRLLYIRSAERVFGRNISEAEYLYILSGIRFFSTRALYWGKSVNPVYIRDFILDGVIPDEECSGDPPPLPDRFAESSSTTADTGYEKLIESGLKLFGNNGYYNTGIADIARESGLAVGTFYSHFESKEVFLKILVERISRETRHYLSEHTEGEMNRTAREVLGIWYFLNYFSNHLEYYSIVREAEFVSRELVNDYYNSFEHGYINNLQCISSEDMRYHAANFLMGLSHYTGIEVLHRKRISDLKAFLMEIMTLISNGIVV